MFQLFFMDVREFLWENNKPKETNWDRREIEKICSLNLRFFTVYISIIIKISWHIKLGKMTHPYKPEREENLDTRQAVKLQKIWKYREKNAS